MIEIKGVGQRFPEVGWVFRNVSWRLGRGKRGVILGPSGSGKSTLLRLLAGLEPATEGTVSVASDCVGMLFQRNALFDSFTVLENLLFPLRERLRLTGPGALDRAREWLGAVGLAGTEALAPRDLSGGMQKRLGIARALIVEPDVILYDDPTAGLDPITSRTIAELITRLARERSLTAAIVTNDVDRAFELGDEIHLLAQGRWIEGGAPETLLHEAPPELRQFLRGDPHGPLTDTERTRPEP